MDQRILAGFGQANVIWRPTITRNDFFGIACGNNTFVAVGKFETILQSELTRKPAPSVRQRFDSGKIAKVDSASKSISVRLFDTASDKVLKVLMDDSTTISDGLQRVDFNSLMVGAEVDIEYDPASNKAVDIFVY